MYRIFYGDAIILCSTPEEVLALCDQLQKAPRRPQKRYRRVRLKADASAPRADTPPQPEPE